MTRWRDFGPARWHYPTGLLNAITDVPGVRVGHTTLKQGDAIRTGVTAILPHGDNLYAEKVPAAVHTINGFGKPIGFEQVRELGTIETPVLLTSTLNVPRVADALISYMIRQNPTLRSVNPLVAECNDGFLNNGGGRYVDEAAVFAAIETAHRGAVAEGNQGAGTGMICYHFKGGIGTASRITRNNGDYTVGALLLTNFGQREDLIMAGVPVGQRLKDDFPLDVGPGPGSLVAVIATDAPLTPRQLGRLARRVAFGVARTGTIGQHGSGDFAIAFSTAYRLSHAPGSPQTTIPYLYDHRLFDVLARAVVESVEEAIYNALIAAETMTSFQGRTVHALPHDRLRTLLQSER